MNVKWKDKTERVSTALDLLAKSKFVTPNGDSAFDTRMYGDAIQLLLDATEFFVHVEQEDLTTIIVSAVGVCAREKNLTEIKLLSSISSKTDEYLMKPLNSYFLYSSIDTRSPQLWSKRTWGKAVKTLERIPRKFASSREQIAEAVSDLYAGREPLLELPVLVDVKARSPDTAFRLALAEYAYVRALWNFSINNRVHSTFGNSSPAAFNKFLTGPVHTLHNKDGSLATTNFWYEPTYLGIRRIFFSAQEVSHAEKVFEEFHKTLKSHPDQVTAKQVLIGYVNALDQLEPEKAFLQLWNALEQLVGTRDPQESSRRIVHRASSIFTDFEYAEAVMKTLQERRNKLVHEGGTAPRINYSLHQLRRIVEAVIELYLKNAFRIKSHAEFLEVLDMPRSLKLIEKRLRVLRIAKQRLERRSRGKQNTQADLDTPIPKANSY
jgi:hypothetical protein